MLDAAYVREHIDEVRRGLQSRGLQPDAELEQLGVARNTATAADPGDRGPEARAEHRRG